MRFTPLFLRTSCWLLVIFVFLNACVGEECETVSDPVMRVSFARFIDAERTEEQAVTVAFKHIYGIGANPQPPRKDDSLVRSKAAIAGLRIPLSQVNDMSTFVFVRDSLANDTIFFTYTRKPYFRSQACGFEMEFENLRVIKHSRQNIDTVLVTQPSVNAQNNNANVKIYFD
ncbi:hypothetical protein GXP67_19400 [Rhodocytophaga rosea]|uniref:Uncharacterized protein n=1 Tax=Rhodocytophaga rosea TaxID=2704465 RepID=A0A6C0GKT7_9BACT|nr:DUF6452 family protein [Rhodocytophaga rosea]QHT68656.1 hypothetical protein GXP67_19400 [Rhodocytophaga rosea]